MNISLLGKSVAAAALIPFASAQSTGLRTHYRIVSAVLSQPSPTNYLNHDSGWVSGPVLLSADANGNQVGGCFANGLCNAFASYGELRVLGTGNASSCAASGVALALDEWSGGMPKAQFLDVLFVQSATLPIGAPVQIDFAMDFTGNAAATGVNPSSTISASLLLAGTPVLTATAPGFRAVAWSTYVGAVLPINGQLRVTLGDQALIGGSTYSVDLRAEYAISTNTAGATLTTLSGETYAGLSPRAIPFGSGCGTAPPTLAATPPQLGAVCTFTVGGAPPNAPVLLALCTGGVTPWSLGACTVYVAPSTTVVTLAGVSSPTGLVTYPLAIPPLAQLAGLWLTSQAMPLVASGPFLGFAELSNAVTLTLGS